MDLNCWHGLWVEEKSWFLGKNRRRNDPDSFESVAVLPLLT